MEPILLIHGGAGNITDARVPGKLDGMKKALRSAKDYLWPSNGGEANVLDAVEAAVRAMETDPNFNAGYGACLNREQMAEVEASIMEGKELKAGCVTLLHDILHPISVARRVMEKTNHTFLGGSFAERFAKQEGFQQLQQGSLITTDARLALNEFNDLRAKGIDTTYARTELDAPGEPGTVGAVAIDSKGNIAVATSTGGITGKLPGRIGDTPLLGCGTYADNTLGGVSTTGHGETIMRFNLAQKILSKIQYEKKSAQEATEEACNEMTERLVGTGGAITIDAKGEIGIYWTSKRMAWAYTKGKDIVFGINHNEKFVEQL
ncbi:putative isoaspartyl peptidase/L-asparaginase [Lucilia cuprina]|uniref:Putative isoaspartyl peptidase/L-asparaginase n=1 Tax=Lucilia cuprina TaxID=7375 RepID=A0A0L0CLN2_LUCCU|nr:putative isoaspartyl peptidase/L-asparaginase [Lucilia cuprina]KNC32354.1 putative isoaspartyl peptidase/L-asparaginase [Lucilia cuprina]